jgi:precorrin-2 dehydrogenase/sirohydrochlorin ferrochelatase
MCPAGGLGSEMKYRIHEEKSVDVYLDQSYKGPEEIEGYDMVLTAIDDIETSREICRVAREKKIPVNVADVPPECDFYFGSLIRRGPLQVMVSTGGKGPRIAATTRSIIERALPDNIGKAIENVGMLRAMLRKKVPEAKKGARRMKWMIDVCDTWKTDELAEMTKAEMEMVLSGWDENGKIYSARDVRGWSWWLTPDQASVKKAIVGRCPVVGYVSPWLSGFGGAVLGAACATAIMALKQSSRR